MATHLLVSGFIVLAAAPPAILLLYWWAWLVLLMHARDPCEEPLAAWLFLYLSHILLSRYIGSGFMQWLQSRLFLDRRCVDVLRYCGPAFSITWLALGRCLTSRSPSCSTTSALHTFIVQNSWAAVMVHLLQLVRLFAGATAVPLLRVTAWMAEDTELCPPTAADPDTINNMELVDYKPELFADPADGSDTRPQGECCICLQRYGEEQIARTPCGHLMHRDCLAGWLRSARSCPTCRADVQHLQQRRTDDIV